MIETATIRDRQRAMCIYFASQYPHVIRSESFTVPFDITPSDAANSGTTTSLSRCSWQYAVWTAKIDINNCPIQSPFSIKSDRLRRTEDWPADLFGFSRLAGERKGSKVNSLWYKPLAETLLSEIEASGRQLSRSTAEAILDVPRHAFLRKIFVMSNREGTEWLPYNLDYKREHDRRLAYRDKSFVVQTRNGIPSITSNAPGVIVKSLEAHQMKKGRKVLEVGAGTGYSAALISEIVEDPSLVTSIEIDGFFARQAKENLYAVNLDKVTVVKRDGTYGYEPNAPYEKILVNSSCRHIPKYWLNQLTPAGSLLSIRKDSHTQQLLYLERKDGQLSGPSLGFAAFPELNRTENERVAILDFPHPVVKIPWDSHLTLSREQKSAFQLLKDDDFRFYFQLVQPNLHVLDMTVEESMAGDNWRPAIIDAATNETIFFGPMYDDGEHSCESYGNLGTLALFLSVCDEWKELGRPQVSEFWFTALSSDHSRLQQRGMMKNSKSCWHIPSHHPDYLDWVIELKA